MVQPRSDRQTLDLLASQAVEGNARAREDLAAALRVRLLPVAKRRVREDDSEDVVQEVLRILFEKLSRQEIRGPILLWAYRVQRNVIGNYYQRRRRQGTHVPLDEGQLSQRDEGHRAAGRGDDPSTDRIADPDGLSPELAAALQRLARRYPRCAVLFGLILQSLADTQDPRIATRRALERMRLQDDASTRGALYVLLHRCRGRLRALVDPS